MVDGWKQVLSRSPEEQQNKLIAARQRVLDGYRVEDMANYYNRLYRQLGRGAQSHVAGV